MLGNAKSNRHRKTQEVEPDDTGRNIGRLTRGDLPSESPVEVSRGRSSEESRWKPEGAKGQRTKRQTSWKNSGKAEREVSRNSLGASQEHTSKTAQEEESKVVDLLEEAYRGEASPYRTRYSAEVLNEMTMDEVLLASSSWQDAVG